MLLVRAVVLLLLVAGLLCFAMYLATGRKRWRGLALRIVKWTVLAVLAFFAVLIVERAWVTV